jgi:hypothetical protein
MAIKRARPKLVLPALPSRPCLGIEMGGNELRAVLVRKGARRSEIADYLFMPDVDSGNEELPSIPLLKETAQRLNVRGRIPAVYTSAQVRAATLPMSRTRVQRMRRQLLIDALKWEAEAYTGIPGYQALIGLEVERPRIEPGQVVEESDEIMVHVAAIEANVYRALRERFRLAGLTLMRAYPPDYCFQVPLLELHPHADRGVLEIGATASRFALLKGGDTLAINTMNITQEMIHQELDGRSIPDLETTLRYNLEQAPGPYPVAVTGVGALCDQTLAYLQRLAPQGVEPLKLARASALTAAGQEEGPAMATVAGAALRELGGRDLRQIGVTDAVPFATQVRRSAYVMPLATASLLFVLLLVHYGLMVQQERRFNVQRAELEQDLGERRAELSEAQRLQAEIETISDRISLLSRQLAYVRGDWDQALRTKVLVYEGLRRQLSPSIALARIQQDPSEENRFIITGMGPSAAEIMAFALRLQESGVAAAVDVPQLVRTDKARVKGVSHRFTIHLEANVDGS